MVNDSGRNNVTWTALIVACCAATGAGCSDRLPPMHDSGGFDIATFGGAVDETLPPEVQTRQGILRDVLNELVSGSRVEDLPDEMRNVKFAQSADEFYRGALKLRRWDFDGPAQGEAFPVKLEFVVDDVKKIDRTDRRAFKVGGKAGKWVVTPAVSGNGQ